MGVDVMHYRVAELNEKVAELEKRIDDLIPKKTVVRSKKESEEE